MVIFGERRGPQRPNRNRPKSVPRRLRRVEVFCPRHHGHLIACFTTYGVLVNAVSETPMTDLDGRAYAACLRCHDPYGDFSLDVEKLQQMAARGRRTRVTADEVSVRPPTSPPPP